MSSSRFAPRQVILLITALISALVIVSVLRPNLKDAASQMIAEHIQVPEVASVVLSAPKARSNSTWHRQLALEHKFPVTEVPTRRGLLDRTRVALIMENRPLPYLVPLIIHFIATVPPEWSFRFMGSPASLEMLNDNPLIRRYVNETKLFLDMTPHDLVQDISSYDTVNHLLTRPEFYAEWLYPAEWLFLFQDDSMICSQSRLTVNDFVDEDWSFMGAKTGDDDLSTGGGFSLRKVPHILRILKEHSFEKWQEDGQHPSEDYYYSTAMRETDWAKLPFHAEAMQWGLVRHFPADMQDMPLGFHPFSSDGMFRGPRGQVNQNRAYEYCPELAIISTGRWNCTCSPEGRQAGGLGG